MTDGARAAADAGESPLPMDGRGAAVTVGTFDGVHRGHHAVLRRLRERAGARDARGVLVTFRPHPLRVVRPEEAPPLLTTLAEKKEALAATGPEYALFLPFTAALARLSPREFVERILLRRLRMVDLVVGHDHGLGRGRSGGVDTLRRLGRELGFDVDVVEAVDVGEAPVSSTRIREALRAGDVVGAAAALGRPYAFRGRVVRGDGRGRALGFPTANLRIGDPRKLLPREGVYAVRAHVRRRAADGHLRPASRFAGALHLGPRPTFPDAAPTAEVHLLDFDGAELYGAEIEVELCARLRGIEAFDSADALVAAMRRDVAAVRARLRDADAAANG